MDMLSEIINYLHLLRDGAIAEIVCAVLVTVIGGLTVGLLCMVAQLRRELTGLRLALFPPPPPPPAPSYPIPPRPGPVSFDTWEDPRPGSPGSVASRKDAA